MTVNRSFSDTTKKNAILRNLQSNAGEFHCETCGLLLDPAVERFHFDHIKPYAKGGRSTLANCQVLCEKCNLKKNDRELKAFQLEQKAMHLLEQASKLPLKDTKKAKKDLARPNTKSKEGAIGNFSEESRISPQESDRIAEDQILSFVSEHGGIRKADLNRKSNQLPSISYVRNRWGGIIPMKEALGIQSGLQKWNRKQVEDTLKQWIEEGGDLLQSDLLQKNRLPSLPCILRYFPELKSFNEIKEHFGLQRTHEEWTKDKAINAGKKFISNHGPHLRQYHLNKTNGLPTARTIDRLFGSLRNYQETIGSSIHDRNKKKTVDDVKAAIDELFGHKERVVRNKTDFYKRFRISDAAISRLFGSTDRLFSEHSIKELEPKRASFSKDEIEQKIMEFVKKKGERIPKPRELKKYGLPSKDTIEKYYQSYRQPFIYFYRMISKSN